MNLNKFTKAELISKMKKQQSKNDNLGKEYSIIIQIKSYFYQIWELILTFKNILVKLTLISLVINILKKYSLLTRMWRIINSIIVTIFGLSLIDNFGFEFLSNFFKEIKFIVGNIIEYFTNTSFYQYLNKLFSNDIIHENNPSNEKSIFRESSWDATKEKSGISEDNKQINRNSKINEWLNSKEENKPEKEDGSNYTKYLIIVGLAISSCLIWVYFDELKTGCNSLIEWIQSFRGNNDPGAPDSTGDTPQRIDRLTIRERLEKQAQEKIKTENVRFRGIDLEDNSVMASSSKTKLEDPMNKYFAIKEKSKSVLTSPSLDDLNNKAKESWGENPGSPESNSSTETIKPLNPFSNDTSEFTTKLARALFWRENWMNVINPNESDKIKFIEHALKSNEHFDEETVNKLIGNFTDIVLWYNENAENYSIIKPSNINEKEVQDIRELAFQVRIWISDNYSKVFPNSNNIIELTNSNDAPKKLNLDLFTK